MENFMTKLLLLCFLFLSYGAIAHESERCEDQYLTYCECAYSYHGSSGYTLKLAILNLKTDKKKSRRIGRITHTGAFAHKLCLEELDLTPVCR